MIRVAIVVLVVMLVPGGLFFLLPPDTPEGGTREQTFDMSIESGSMSPEEISVN